MDSLEVRTIWRTASEHCELVFSQNRGYRLRLWVDGRLMVDEMAVDAESAIQRAWELRVEWPGTAD